MSLPPGFLDELRGRLSLAQVVGRKVIWDPRKSNQGKGDMWAPCPFHQEKTASFHVDDRKGYYYCFGCQAKGDAISFVRETENVGFMEAVEILAGEAGMPMPARDPQAQQKADRRTQLSEVMEQAVRFFRMQLRSAAGAAARAYLDGRGLDNAAQDRWEIGFAPDVWQALGDHLRGQGVGDDLLADAGLVKPSSNGRAPYDTFRGRIMFPIRDPRGRCIAFGGRAMDPTDNAKYLNSPETLLFDKGRTLFNHGPARTAAGKGQPLIVAEGYMDVIALSEAGFGAAVAPLGTAVTDTQLQMLWRITPEPMVALDGDAAGLRAAMRVMDLALPVMEAGQSLRFALMPDGKDPDDVLRAGGAGAMQALLEDAQPMVRLMWRRETEGQRFDTPESRATLDKALRTRLRSIGDPSLREHYGQALREMRAALFGTGRAPARGSGGGGKRGFAPARVSPAAETRGLAAAMASERALDEMRESVILAAVISTPAILPDVIEVLEALDCQQPSLSALRDVALACVDTPDALRQQIVDQLGPQALETLMSARHIAIAPCVRRAGDVDLAHRTVAEEQAKLAARRGLVSEISEAAQDVLSAEDEKLTYRLAQAAEARNRALRSAQKDKAHYDTGDNGALINREEREALDALMNQIGISKPGQ